MQVDDATAPVLIVSVISALNPTTYNDWLSQMRDEAKLSSILTKQEEKLVINKNVASKFLFVRAIPKSELSLKLRSRLNESILRAPL